MRIKMLVRGCLRKESYTLDGAYNQLAKNQAKSGFRAGLGIYECEVCGAYHLGHSLFVPAQYRAVESFFSTVEELVS